MQAHQLIIPMLAAHSYTIILYLSYTTLLVYFIEYYILLTGEVSFGRNFKKPSGGWLVYIICTLV